MAVENLKLATQIPLMMAIIGQFFVFDVLSHLLMLIKRCCILGRANRNGKGYFACC